MANHQNYSSLAVIGLYKARLFSVSVIVGIISFMALSACSDNLVATPTGVVNVTTQPTMEIALKTQSVTSLPTLLATSTPSPIPSTFTPSPTETVTPTPTLVSTTAPIITTVPATTTTISVPTAVATKGPSLTLKFSIPALADFTDSASLDVLIISPDGRLIAAAVAKSSDQIKIWQAKDGRLLTTIQLPDPQFETTLAFSPDSKTIAGAGTLSAPDEFYVGVWDIVSGKQLKLAATYILTVWQSFRPLVFSPNGKTVIALMHTHLADLCFLNWNFDTEKYDVARNNKCDYLNWYPMDSPIMSPNQKLVAGFSSKIPGDIGGVQAPKVWDIATHKTLAVLEDSSHLQMLKTFSPNNKTLVGLDDAHYLSLWDVKSGKKLGTFDGYGDDTTTLIFSPDGKFMFGTNDAGIHIWDVTTKHIVFDFSFGQTKAFQAIAISADGKLLVSSHEDGSIKVWQVNY